LSEIILNKKSDIIEEESLEKLIKDKKIKRFGYKSLYGDLYIEVCNRM
jgi:hypothetical protein